MSKKKEFFSIAEVHREDLKRFVPEDQADALDDSFMENLALKMGDAYVDNGFWADLEIILEDMMPDGLSSIACPECSGRGVVVVELTIAETGEVLDELQAPLDKDGFVWDPDNRYDGASSENEVARCKDCDHEGSLAEFGFGT